MTITALRQLASSFVIAVALLAFVHDAYASDSTITYSFPTSDLSGITAQTAPGIGGCLAGCASFRVASLVAIPAKRQAFVQIAAPGGTSIVGGAVSLSYRTKSPAISVHIQNRVNGRWFDTQRLRSTTATRKVVKVGGSGNAVAISLMADAAIKARGIPNDAENTVSIDSVSLTVRDVSAPVVSWTAGDPATGQWQRGAICGTFNARDTGLGVDRVEYVIGSAVATVTAPPGTRSQPRPLTFAGSACVDSAQLADGVYGTTLAGIDANSDGNRSTPVNGLVRVDNSAPTVVFVAPTDTEARQPQLQLQLADSASGVTTVGVSLDGMPVEAKRTGELAVVSPPLALADGLHRLSWTVADAAGNVTQDAATFGVSDVTPPVIDQTAPSGLTTPATPIRAHIVDAGSGVAVDSIRLAVDGCDVTALVDVANGVLVYQPARAWGEGEHSVRLTVGDRSGNRTVLSWTFQLPVGPGPVPVQTPPAPSIDTSAAISTGEPSSGAADGAMTISAPSTVVIRGPKTIVHISALRGTIPAAGQRLRVSWLRGQRLADVVADDQGYADVTLTGAESGTLVVAAGGVQAQIVVTSGPTLSLKTGKRSVRQGGLLRLHGVLRGSDAAQIRLEAKVGRGWRLVVSVPVGKQGSYATPVRLPAIGTYVVRMRAGTVVSAPLRLVAR